MEFASVEPTPVTLYLGEENSVTTDVNVAFNEETTDSDVAGEDLWQMAVWFSKTDTGKGSKKGFTKSAMTEAQGEMPVDFEDFEVEVNMNMWTLPRGEGGCKNAAGWRGKDEASWVGVGGWGGRVVQRCNICK